MTVTVYLHDYIAETLSMYGYLDDVVNKILDESENGAFEIENKPECAPRDGASRYDINIKNESYIDLLMTFGTRSSRVSLRRLLYWFVDNEVYLDCGWETKYDYVSKKDKKYNDYLDDVISKLYKMNMIHKTDDVSNIIKKLSTLRRN